MGNAAGRDNCFLCFFAFGVPVVRERVNDGRADMNDIGHIMCATGGDDVVRGVNIIALELVLDQTADVGLQHDSRRRVGEGVLPIARVGDVGLDGGNARMQALQDA